MDIIPIPTRLLHGNDLYPLPPDYFELLKSSDEAGRQCRVNACRQWLIPRKQVAQVLAVILPAWGGMTDSEKDAAIDIYRAEALIASVRFFDDWYLKADSNAEVEFDPLFYDEDPLPTPDFHWGIIRGWATFRATLDIAMRGGAKSMTARKVIMLRMISRPVFKILYCTSSQRNATDTAQMVRNQLYTNQRIQDDWRPEMPDGDVRPRRGNAPTGIEFFQLGNGSQLATYSVNSKMRGGRPRWFVLDDPEHDPHASTSMAERRQYMNRLIFKVAMPMLMRKECSISWLATFVSKRHYAWAAMQTEPVLIDGKIEHHSTIPEFSFWQRSITKICKQIADGTLVSAWPHMWPADEAEKVRLGLEPSTMTLGQVRQFVGAANWTSEYMANPGDTEESFFNADEKKHGWWFLKSSVDEFTFTDPHRSQTVMKWMSGEEEKSSTLSDFLKGIRLFITVDTSKTAKKDSDFKVCTLMGENIDRDLFALDMYAGQVQPERLIDETFKMAARWKCRYIFVEEIEDGIVLVRSMKNLLTREAQKNGLAGLPAVKGFNPGYTKKTTKIAALAMRFEHGKIKLPYFRRLLRPWADLFDQIDGFNPDVDDGGLANDDHLDTVSMSEYVVTGRLPKGSEPDKEELDPFKLLVDGQRTDRFGIPLVQFIDLSKISIEQAQILAAAFQSPPKSGNVI